MLFRTSADRRSFLGIATMLDDRYGVELVAYVLMGNHYHLIVRSREGRVSVAMQYLDGQFARHFNARHQRDGSLFKGRFDSNRIDSDAYLIQAGAYVHLNPVQAGLVDRAIDYPWSSLRFLVGGDRSPKWLASRWLLRDRSGDDYVRFVESQRAEVERLATPAWDSGVDWWMPSLEEPVLAAIAAADERVASTFSVSVDELYAVVRGRLNPARMVAIAYTADRLGLSHADVAIRYGLKNRHSVRSTMRRLREQLRRDPGLQALVASLGLAL